MAEVFGVKDDELAGGYIPRQLSEQLNLFALLQNKTRSEIVRNLIVNLIEEMDLNETVQSIAERVISSWKEQKGITFEEYRKSVRSALEHKKITDTYISIILIKAKELHDANKTSGKAKNK